MRSSAILDRRATCVGLALLPMSLALAGVVVEERTRLGFSTWLSAVALAPSTTIVVARPRKKATVISTICSRRAWKVKAK